MAHETLTFTIPVDLATALRDAVASGEYATADDALADALATWARREEDREEQAAWLRAKVSAALNDPRPSLSLEEVDRHLDAFYLNVERSRSGADEAA